MVRIPTFAFAAPVLLAGAVDTGDLAQASAMVLDDECMTQGLDGACSLNALQFRSHKKSASKDAWHFWGSSKTSSAAAPAPAPMPPPSGGVGAEGEDEADPKTEELGSGRIKHYALNCKDACGGSGFCEDYCGLGNACCNYYARETVECDLATFFPVLIPNFWTCVTTAAEAPQGSSRQTSAQRQCDDKSTSCPAWAARGECTRNPEYMKDNCCRSCGSSEQKTEPMPASSSGRVSSSSAGGSSGDCEDKMVSCPIWAKRGECESSEAFMKQNCCAACSGGKTGGGEGPPPVVGAPSPGGGGDPDCKDSNDSCPGWAIRGECKRNEQWMKANCKLSCKVCTPPTAAEPETTTTTSKVEMTSTMTPTFQDTDCKTATADDESTKACFDAVQWVFAEGIYQHPDWYYGLLPNSPWESAQYVIHQTRPDQCPAPCAPTEEGCETVTSGECFNTVLWAKTDGIFGHPEWFPELKPESPIEDFQMHMHNKNQTLCPKKPCKK